MGVDKHKRSVSAPSFVGDGRGLTGVLRTGYAKYSFAVDGGAVGAITPVTSDSLPANAIIVGGQVYVESAALSGGAATVSVGTVTGTSATSLLAATAKASLGAQAALNVVPTFAAASRMSVAGKINITVGTAALTAGIVHIWVVYFVPA